MSAGWLLLILALVAGISIPIQAGVNATLDQTALHSPVLAATVSFAVGTVALLLYTWMTRLALPPMAQLSDAPVWSWFGGIIGAFFVTSTILLAPKLGATTMLATLLAGQMVASLVLDHFGLLGFPLHPISWMRLGGVVLVAAGVYLIRVH